MVLYIFVSAEFVQIIFFSVPSKSVVRGGKDWIYPQEAQKGDLTIIQEEEPVNDSLHQEIAMSNFADTLYQRKKMQYEDVSQKRKACDKQLPVCREPIDLQTGQLQISSQNDPSAPTLPDPMWFKNSNLGQQLAAIRLRPSIKFYFNQSKKYIAIDVIILF